MSYGTEGRVYGGNPKLLHVKDGTRAQMGEHMAGLLDQRMGEAAFHDGQDPSFIADAPLCPGCYMVVAFDMLIHLADQNNQSRTELARTMMGAFQKLLDDPSSGLTEEIEVLLDPEDPSNG